MLGVGVIGSTRAGLQLLETVAVEAGDKGRTAKKVGPFLFSLGYFVLLLTLFCLCFGFGFLVRLFDSITCSKESRWSRRRVSCTTWWTSSIAIPMPEMT